MKRVAAILTVLAIILGTGVLAKADVYVRGYYRSNGTYVQPHHRSNPDGNVWNNWSTYPNVNPYTGSLGTRRTINYPPSPSLRVPTYNWTRPNPLTSHLPSPPRFPTPSYGTSRGSLWQK